MRLPRERIWSEKRSSKGRTLRKVKMRKRIQKKDVEGTVRKLGERCLGGSVELLTSAQVMISRFVRWSPTLGWASSLLEILSLCLSLPLSLHMLSLSLKLKTKQNKKTQTKLEGERGRTRKQQTLRQPREERFPGREPQSWWGKEGYGNSALYQ